MPRRRRIDPLKPPPTSDEQLAEMRAVVRAGAADRPGVYQMHSANGEVVYVGKSKQVRTRLLSYFRCAYPEEKGARIIREATRVSWDYTPSEFAALLEELRLIKLLRPRYNVSMKSDARNFVFIKLTRGTAPKLLVVRGASEDAATYYGPFQGARRVDESLRELNDALGLRDCANDRKMYFADQQELFQIARTPGCIRYDVRKCLGPCIGACSEREYMERVSHARAFLDGADDGPLEQMRQNMEASSARLEFERAASLRDKLYRLQELREQFIRFRYAVETLSFLYMVPGHENSEHVYVIRRGRVRHVQEAPRTVRQRAKLAALVADVYGVSEPDTAQVPTHEVDELLLLSSWFRRFPKEMERTVKPEEYRGRQSA